LTAKIDPLAGPVIVTTGEGPTTTVAVQLAEPAAFSAVIVTVYVPGPTIVPPAGDWETVTLQPVATTSPVLVVPLPTMFGIAAWQLESTGTVLLEAQVVIVGAAAGTTVTVKLQLAPALLLQFTGVAPTGNVEPDGGKHATVPQEPLVVGSANVTTLLHWPAGAPTVISPGQLSVQLPLTTVTLKVQLTVLLDESVAVQVTVVAPRGKDEPAAGLQATVTQFPVVPGAG